ncbi:PASTA domain-containing protein [uncultured Bifidobacterium sp.]|uniref:protein kinase domain-containing protein n=1 Tax=uncultured Bifidobacterium sp. TaxID=165187 RepID=UPI002612D65E|nr:PASTA domain-containing protein [uncultured Bifidobacterium sp.]
MGDSTTQVEGTVIDGRYRITRRIAAGGMATVFLAIDGRLDRNVAIKVMHTQLANGPHREQFVERFHREARSAAAIANPHIVQVYDTGEYSQREYLVMEYVHGVNLRDEMSRRSTFDVRSTFRILAETLDGLAAAHAAGLVHRDIKPENILINDRGRVQITDFGLAKAASQATLSSTGMLLGTASYLAPELIEKNISTPQGDLYSVGMMAWEMLAGRLPFVSDNPVTLVFRHVHDDVPPVDQVCPGIDPAIVAFIRRLTARDPSQRPRDAVEAFSIVRDLVRGLPAAAWDYRLSPAAAPFDVTGRSDVTHESEKMDERSLANPVAPTDLTGLRTNQPDQTGGTNETDVDAARTPFASQDTQVSQYDDAEAGRTGFPGDAMATMPLAGDESVRPHAHRRAVIITLILSALVLAAAAGTGVWWYMRGPGSYWTLPKPAGLSCSSDTACVITNVSWKNYQRSLTVVGIPYSVTTSYSDDVATGKIISTSPSTVGSHVGRRTNDTVSVVVSKGVRKATVPNDILDTDTTHGKNPIAALQKAGFTNIAHNDDSDSWSLSVPKGSVISISLDPGTTANHSTPITVVLSKGPMPVSMPDIVGKTKSEAQSSFDDAKLTATYTEEYSDTVKKGVVISAEYAAGKELYWGDTVSVVVSKGPEMVTIPDVRGMSTTKAKSVLTALGLRITVSAPLGDLTHTVRLQSISPGTQSRLRSEKGVATSITLTVV